MRKYDLENSDSSEATTWKKIEKETELWVILENRLRDQANGLFSAPQEEEMSDKKKPDFRIHAPHLDAPAPIELKVADNWSIREFKKSIDSQLIGQYLRDQRSTCGIFLIVYKGQKGYWRCPESGERLNFELLLDELKIFANKLLTEIAIVEAIEVVGINLTLR